MYVSSLLLTVVIAVMTLAAIAMNTSISSRFSSYTSSFAHFSFVRLLILTFLGRMGSWFFLSVAAFEIARC